MEALAAAGRFAQLVAAAILFGWPLFQLYAAQRRPAPRAVLVFAALLGLLGGLAALAAETATMTGAAESAWRPADWWAVLSSTTYGHGMAARLALLSAAALATRAATVSAPLALGAAICASFAWTGHAAGGEGTAGALHRVADIVHVLAAAAWLGALAALLLSVLRSLRTGEDAPCAAFGLARFSGVGAGVVAALVLSGLVNSWMLVGPGQVATLLDTAYGRLLATKLCLFALMLGLAGANRYVLAPRLTRSLANPSAVGPALAALRLSLLLESGLGLAVLAAVSLLGLLPPPGMG